MLPCCSLPQGAAEECKQNGGAGDTEVKEENGKAEENGKEEAEKKEEKKKEEKKKKKLSFRSISFLRREKKHKEVKEAKDKNGDVSTVFVWVPACRAGGRQGAPGGREEAAWGACGGTTARRAPPALPQWS